MATDVIEEQTASRSITDLWESLSLVWKIVIGVGLGLLVAALAVPLVLISWGRPNLVPLLEGYEFTTAERQAAISAIQTAKLKGHEYEGMRIMVPKSDVNDYLEALAGADALPGNFFQPYDQYTRDTTWYRSQTDGRRQFKVAEQKAVSQVISSFPEIVSATVLVAEPPKIGLRQRGKAKASVKVSTLGAKPLAPGRILQIQNLVANAFADLHTDDVYVVGDFGPGMSPGTDARQRGVNTEITKITNQHLQSKKAYAEAIELDLLQALSWIEGIDVVVNVEVDPDKAISEQTVKYEKGVPANSDSTEISSGSSSGAGPGGPVGVRPNVTVPEGSPNAALSATAVSSTDTESTTRTEYQNPTTKVDKMIQGFTPNKVGVLVKVPERYRQPQTIQGATEQQQQETAQTYVSEQQIMDAVAALGYPGVGPDTVKVMWFTPPTPPTAPRMSTVTLVTTTLSDNLSSIIFGILGLAAIAVAYVVAGRAPQPEITRPTKGEEALEEGLEARPGEGLLPDVHKDEEARRYEQLEEAVVEMVGKRPEMAASLIKRWIAQEE